MTRFAPYLALLLLGSCSQEGTVAARDALDKAGEAARILVEDIDLSAPIALLKEKAGEVVAFLSEQLDAVQDSATAEKVADVLGPFLDSTGELLKKVGEELPSRGELRDLVDRLETRFEADEGVMRHLGPVLEKLSELL